jgi:hypothetical protein
MLFLSVTEIDGRRAPDSVSTTARITAPDPPANTGVTCAFWANSDGRKAAASSRRVVTRESGDGGRISVQVPNRAVELGFSPQTAGHSVTSAARVIVTEVSQSRVGRGGFRAPLRFAVSSTSGDAADVMGCAALGRRCGR